MRSEVIVTKCIAMFLILGFMAPILVGQESPPEYFQPKNILRFAESLFHAKDYGRAAGEFQRYLFCEPQMPSDAPEIIFKIGLCFLKNREFAQAIIWFEKLLSATGNEAVVVDSALFHVAYALFLDGQYERSLSYISAHAAEIKKPEEMLKMSELQGLNYFFQKKWGLASLHFSAMEKKDAGSPGISRFTQLALQGKTLPRKNPWLAAALSAIIPGMGKVYAKKPLEGLMSFLTVGSSLWLTYQNFHRDGIGSVKGWVYGVMGGFFYLGNVYGSAVAVKVYNRQAEDALLHEAGIAISISFK